MMSYSEQIAMLNTFIGILTKASTAEEFHIECVMNGCAEMATKDFFDTNIFEFVYGPGICHKKLLKAKIFLRNNIAKLHRFYVDFVKEM